MNQGKTIKEKLQFFFTQKGVTLVELVVVLALFMVIMGVVVSLFISIINQQRAVLREQSMLNQASYLTDYLSRSIRMSLKDVAGNCLTDENGPHAGSIYLLTHQNGGYYQGIKLLTSNGVCQEVFLDTDNALKEIKDGGAAQNILSNTMSIEYARFIINGDKDILIASETDQIQPRVTFVVNLQIQDQETVRNFIIQDTISQVNLNF